MKKATSLLLATMLAGAFTAASCSKSDNTAKTDSTTTATVADSSKQGDGIGKVAGLDTGMHTVTLSHNDVPGIMEAMTMEYTLEKPELAKNFAVGDSVKFTMKEPQTGTFVISAIQKLH